MKTCETPSNVRLSRYLIPAALFGLFVAIATNLVALYGFEKSSAVFFSEQWWAVWLPSYIISLSFAFMSVAMWVGERVRR